MVSEDFLSDFMEFSDVSLLRNFQLPTFSDLNQKVLRDNFEIDSRISKRQQLHQISNSQFSTTLRLATKNSTVKIQFGAIKKSKNLIVKNLLEKSLITNR